MLASVAGAVAGWAIFSVVTVDVATKKKIIIADNTNLKPQGVPQFDWLRIEEKHSDDFEADDENKAKKIGTDWINEQIPIYSEEKIINFKSYKKEPLFFKNNNDESWIEEPFVFFKTKAPKAWYLVTKWIYPSPDDIVEWRATYDLFYHPPI